MRIKSITWVGGQADGSSITGVGFDPDIVLEVAEAFVGGAGGCFRTASMSGDLTKPASATALAANYIQSLITDGFTIGTAATVNLNNTKNYSALCILTHSADCKQGTYTGNGTSQGISGIGFAPDLVLVFGDTTQQPVWGYRGIAANNALYFIDNSVITANGFASFDADGFTVGSDATLNSNGVTYYYIAFKEAANFLDILTYAGDGSDNRNISNNDSNQCNDAWVRGYTGTFTNVTTAWHTNRVGPSTDSTGRFNDQNSQANEIQQLTATGVQVGTSNHVNNSGLSYVLVSWTNGNSQAAAGQPISQRHFGIPTHPGSRGRWN